MIKNRLLYVLLLAISAVLFVVHGAWFYWILLLVLLALPFASLLFSLPLLMKFKMHLDLPAEATVGLPVRLQIQISCGKWFALPSCRFRMEITEEMTQTLQYRKFDVISKNTAYRFTPPHCGSYEICITKCRMYDALGLWKLPRKVDLTGLVTVLPVPSRPKNAAEIEKIQPVVFQPKPGGGCAEMHDHREYRPGDSVQEIRWKLSCKTDKLIVREPLIPVQQLIVVLQPAAEASELDLALARLAWVSAELTEKNMPHTVLWGSEGAVLSESVRTAEDVQRILRQVVQSVSLSESLVLPDSCAGAQLLRVNGGESGVQI